MNISENVEDNWAVSCVVWQFDDLWKSLFEWLEASEDNLQKFVIGIGARTKQDFDELRVSQWFPLIYALETFIVWTWWIFSSVNLNMLHIIVSWYSSASRPSFCTFLGRIHNKAGLSVRLPVRMYVCPRKVFSICYTNVCHMTRSKVKVMEVRMLRRLLIS